MGAKCEWKSAGEVICSNCGARYSVSTAELAMRKADFFRCESCGVLMDEWVSNKARLYTLKEAVTATAASSL